MAKKDYISDHSTWALSLQKLTGKQVVDILGRISIEFGEPVFKLSSVVFHDGTQMGCEGEHDMPYLTTYPNQIPPNFDDKTLMAIYREEDIDDE